ncbi:MAG: hypothetical protein GYA52_11315 [Chloroflexi bacterium]|nr:hypothetical protein [Chloroflexota bacterium]
MNIIAFIAGLIGYPKSNGSESTTVPKSMYVKQLIIPSKKELADIQLEVSSNLPEWDKEFFSSVIK